MWGNACSATSTSGLIPQSHLMITLFPPVHCFTGTKWKSVNQTHVSVSCSHALMKSSENASPDLGLRSLKVWSRAASLICQRVFVLKAERAGEDAARPPVKRTDCVNFCPLLALQLLPKRRRRRGVKQDVGADSQGVREWRHTHPKQPTWRIRQQTQAWYRR